MKTIQIFIMLCLAQMAFGQDSLVIYFLFDSDKLSTQQESTIKLKLLKNAAQIHSIKGTTDSIGNFLYNQDLSVRRANSVFHLLDSLNPSIVKDCKVSGVGELPKQGKSARKVVIYYQEKISVKIKGSKIGDKIRLNNLNFQPGSTALMPNSTGSLPDLLKVMEEMPTLKISIEGHICCDSNDVTQLSLARAKLVYDYLVKNGIDAKRLSYKGFGATRPIHPLPELNENEQKENRRVEIRILSK